MGRLAPSLADVERRSWGLRGLGHEELKTQEGMIGRWSAKPTPVARIDFHADQDPEGKKRHSERNPRLRPGRLRVLLS